MPGLFAEEKTGSDKSFTTEIVCVCLCVCVVQDGRADVVANDAGDRVTPAVVAYRDTEQVQHMLYFSSCQFFLKDHMAKGVIHKDGSENAFN